MAYGIPGRRALLTPPNGMKPLGLFFRGWPLLSSHLEGLNSWASSLNCSTPRPVRFTMSWTVQPCSVKQFYVSKESRKEITTHPHGP